MAPLPQALAELSPESAKLAAPVVEQVAQQLTEGLHTARQPLTILTLLTEANRRAGRDGVRTQPRRGKTVGLAVPKACRACGVVLERQDRDHCDECMPDARKLAVAFREAGRAKLEALRASDQDPAHTDTTRRQLAEQLARRQGEARAWEVAHGDGTDPEVFRREILPGLQAVSLGAMARATGLSEGYCSFVRRGIKMPHRRHWDELRKLARS